nr:retrovirus-related Pol polyprotein from transposon TNT 1-94 [Tanacetum cinerariifolium]
MKVEESLNVTFNETPPPSKISHLEDDDLVKEEAIEVSKTRPLGNNLEDNYSENSKIINIKESKSHPLENVIEPKNINEALNDKSWVIAMQEELNKFVSNDIWELVPNTMNMTIIGTKWVFRNKLEKNGVASRTKSRLVSQGYNQQEGIDYDQTYAPIARLESIRILLAYACTLNFKLFQMDVKSAFLNGFINEEVYMAQPLRFINFAKPNHVYRLKKALYRLKKTPKAWYDRLKAVLIKHDYSMGMVDNTLFTNKKDPNLIIVQIYVYDILFGSTCQEMCDDFAKIMHDEFKMKQIPPDDMKEIDLRWQIALLTIRARRFLKKIERKLTVNGNETIGFEEGPNYALMAFSSSNSGLEIVNNCKKGLGSENHNAVPPPYTRNFIPPTPNLSFTGLDEFVNKPIVENYKAKSSEEEPKVVKKNDDAPIIKECVSDDEEEDVSQLKIEKKIVRPSIIKKQLVKSKQQEKTARKTVKQVE